MKPDTIDQEYIKPIVEENLANILPANYCNEFNDFISVKYPWHEINPYRIDWDKVDNFQRLDWLETSEAEIAKFLHTTCLHSFFDVGIIYGASEPGLIIEFKKICKDLNLEKLSAHTPLTLFLVGAKKSQYGVVELEHTCFVELDLTKNWLTAPINSKSLLLY